MREDSPQLLLFDLGRVLVEVTGERDIQRYLKGPLKVDGRWPAMQIWDEFERGLLTPEEFARRFVAEVSLSIEPARFLTEFEAWTRGFLPGATDILDALRPRFRLAALSNSNVVHWRRNELLGVPLHFERVFGSHELGMRKPAIEVYEHVLTALGVEPAAATFFDDQEANVATAKQLGMRAYCVEGIMQLRACLRELGYLEGDLV